jgi:hypothetical protein
MKIKLEPYIHSDKTKFNYLGREKVKENRVDINVLNAKLNLTKKESIYSNLKFITFGALLILVILGISLLN